MRKTLIALMLVLLLVPCFACAEDTAAELTGTPARVEVLREKYIDTYESMNRAADEKYAPRVRTLENGVRVQDVPNDLVEHWTGQLKSLNGVYLNANNRGCAACHTLEWASENTRAYHPSSFVGGYGMELTVNNCLTCHQWAMPITFKDAIHSTHMGTSTFSMMNGSCESCHYIQDDGTFVLWDHVKYDVMMGITDLTADATVMEFSWDQEGITEREDMWYKMPRARPDEWFTDETATQEALDNWTISVTGDIDNPFQMTLREMIDTFGLISNVQLLSCSLIGNGEPMVMQCEFTGIPMEKIIEYAQPQEGTNIARFLAEDGFHATNSVYLDTAIDKNGMLAVQMNGDTIYPEQGFPVRFICEGISAAGSTKAITEIHILKAEKASEQRGNASMAKPLMGTFNAVSGQIFNVGEKITLEGFAHAHDEPITKIEFSMDGGKTWLEYNIENAVGHRWVRWTLGLDERFSQEGAYLIKMRATSLKPDGTERVAPNLVNFLINVQ